MEQGVEGVEDGTRLELGWSVLHHAEIGEVVQAQLLEIGENPDRETPSAVADDQVVDHTHIDQREGLAQACGDALVGLAGFRNA